MAQHIPVNAGKYSRILGITANRNTNSNDTTIANLSPMVLANICGRLTPNPNLISLFNYQRPIFDNVAKEVMSRVVQRRKAEHVRIYLEWKNEVFERVVDLLDENVKRLTIIGMGNLISTDIAKSYQLLRLCPNITALRLRNINTPLIQHDILQRLPSLVSIDLQLATIPITLRPYPNIMEFICCMGPGDCSLCRPFGDVTQSWFLKFFDINRQIRRVYMHFPGFDCDNCVNGAYYYRNVMESTMVAYQAQDGIVRRFGCNL